MKWYTKVILKPPSFALRKIEGSPGCRSQHMIFTKKKLTFYSCPGAKAKCHVEPWGTGCCYKAEVMCKGHKICHIHVLPVKLS